MSIARDYEIALAELKDIPYLPSIEKAAATLLKGYAPASVLEDTTNHAEFRDAQMDCRLWVARRDDLPVGFAYAELLEPASAHLKELDVHPGHIRRGLGSRLVLAVCAWASAIGCQSLTLTTFRDVAFNMSFYAQLGFEVIPTEGLSSMLRSIIQEESCRGPRSITSRCNAISIRRTWRQQTPWISQGRIEAVNSAFWNSPLKNGN